MALSRKHVLYSNRFGTAQSLGGPQNRRHQNPVLEIKDGSVQRIALKRLIPSLTERHVIELSDLTHLGDSELDILRMLAALLRTKATLKIAKPRLQFRRNSGTANLCLALLEAKQEATRRKKIISAIVTAILQGNGGQVGRPSKKTAELIAAVRNQRAAGASYRRIARDSGISRSMVLSILKTTTP